MAKNRVLGHRHLDGRVARRGLVAARSAVPTMSEPASLADKIAHMNTESQEELALLEEGFEDDMQVD